MVEVTCPICNIMHGVEEEKLEAVKEKYKHLLEFGWKAEHSMLCEECLAFCKTL